MENERSDIIKEIGTWFEEISKDFADDKMFGFVIRNMIARLKQGEIPERKIKEIAGTPLKNEIGIVLGKLKELRNGYRPPGTPAEAASINRMIKKGFTVDQIINTWKSMKKDKFWSNQELFMMSVEKQIGAMTLKNKSNPDKYITGKYGHLVQR